MDRFLLVSDIVLLVTGITTVPVPVQRVHESYSTMGSI